MFYLAILDTKQQALVLGHAITMPVVIQTRLYNEQFYEQMVRCNTLQLLGMIIDQLHRLSFCIRSFI